MQFTLELFFNDSIQGPKKEESKTEKDDYEKSEERIDGHDAEAKDVEGKDDGERERERERERWWSHLML